MKPIKLIKVQVTEKPTILEWYKYLHKQQKK